MQLFEVEGNRGILVYSPPVAALIDAKGPRGFVSVDPQRAANRRVQLFGFRDDVCYCQVREVDRTLASSVLMTVLQ